jgi:hypothetical protein
MRKRNLTRKTAVENMAQRRMAAKSFRSVISSMAKQIPPRPVPAQTHA